MKIDEPKTPYEYASGEDGDESNLSASGGGEDKEKKGDELDAQLLSER